MPDENGKLSDDEFTKAKKWLADKIKAKACPACKSTKLGLSQWIVDLHPLPEYPRLPEVSYPSLNVVCANCGYTQLYNAIIAGIVSRDAPDSDSANSQSSEVKNG